MVIQTLYMDFLDEEGKTKTISIDKPKEDLSELEVKDAMLEAISLDVFEYKLVSAKGARIVTRTIEDLEIN